MTLVFSKTSKNHSAAEITIKSTLEAVYALYQENQRIQWKCYMNIFPGFVQMLLLYVPVL